MAALRTRIRPALVDGVVLLAITFFWTVVMLVFYGVFLATIPPDVDYDAWVYASVFVVPGAGFLAHLLRFVLVTDRV